MRNGNTINVSLEDIKKTIITKEDEITKSQIRKNNLENKKSKLEKQKRNIKKRWKVRLSAIVFHIEYSIVMLLLLAAYITPSINIINTVAAVQKTICIITLYIGVLGITTLGAYFASRIEVLLRNRRKIKSIEISNKIEILEQEIIKEESLQKILKKDITLVLDKLDINKEEILLSKANKKCFNFEEEYIEENHQKKIPHVRKRKKY